MLSLCLFEPEIPQNTGNIARTCAVTGTRLILVRPLGFDISDKAVRHAGLDYWNEVDLQVYDSIKDFFLAHGNDELYFFSTKGRKLFSEVRYPSDSDVYLVFGKESRGIDEEILMQNPERVVRIPMRPTSRSLNLSNSAAIAAYEYYRQAGYPGMSREGQLHNHRWEDL